ncbi:metalloregulator ArsR/SmtB family transcription factor [Acuticoccus sp. MNP-M23]|uniref:ArsR/SmtB family transcription factor n=1 Tax=Acuticoccus sp. MNP-M23 TaxID=3072793 RepID=UPI002815A27D|nr:metalloregulator ArsR/SmtB family transcription factor [Acuticoccus sp. MNP-M23]WMS44054.1 metalloregulator ArsR/SmtB family transcription factor [Acuticoccus sp. MNP-M23]
MPQNDPDPEPGLPATAPVFAALGDRTRLTIVATLSAGDPRSISALADTSDLTRQAVTKHLKVLEGAGLVQSRRIGRETVYSFEGEALAGACAQLDAIARQWQGALGRLKQHVEDDADS